MLLNGADPAAKTNQGATALHLAAGASNPHSVHLLLVAGSDARARDQRGRTALTRVQETRRGDARRREKVATLLKRAMGR